MVPPEFLRWATTTKTDPQRSHTFEKCDAPHKGFEISKQAEFCSRNHITVRAHRISLQVRAASGLHQVGDSHILQIVLSSMFYLSGILK